jgi:ribosomal protein S18 acetylase RimI-like enzyme
MTLVLRETTPDDWQVRREVRLAALRDSPDAFYTTYEQSRTRDETAWRNWPALGRGAIFVAWLDGEPVGIVGIGPQWDNETGTHVDNGIADLFAMWVAPAARGTGVADELIRAAIEWARAAGTDAVELEVAGGNDRARSVYERHGFVATTKESIMTDGLCMRFPLITSDADRAGSATEAG